MAVVNDNMRVLRETKSFSQEAFAQLFGIPRTSYRNFEVDTEPKFDVLLKLVELFRINLNKFLSVPMTSDNVEDFIVSDKPDTTAPTFHKMVKRLVAEEDPKVREIIAANINEVYEYLANENNELKSEISAILRKINAF